MRKSKQNDFEKIVSSKAKEKAKDLAQKLQSREELASLAKPDIKENSNLNSASRKIQKEALQPVRGNPQKKQLKPKLKKEKKPKLLPEGQAPAKAVIVPLDIKRYGEFVKTQNNKYMRIRKRTIETLKFDKNQIKKATKSLLSFFEKQKSQNQHFDKREDFIYLEITLNLAPPQYNVRPIQINIPVPIYGPDHKTKVCLVTGDQAKEFQDKIEELNVPCLTKVIAYNKLMKDYPQLTDKQKLVDNFDLFLCENKIYNLFRKPSGTIFYKKNKIPFPIDCQNVPNFLKDQYKTYEDYLNGFLNFVYFSVGKGPKYTLKVARTSMGVKDIVKNIIHGVYNVIPHVLKDAVKHTKIKQISIKTINSISIPIYNQLSEDELDLIIEEANMEEEEGIRDQFEGMEEEINGDEE